MTSSSTSPVPGEKAETDFTVPGSGSIRTGSGCGGGVNSSDFFFPPNQVDRRNSLGGSGSTWCEALRLPSGSSPSACLGSASPEPSSDAPSAGAALAEKKGSDEKGSAATGSGTVTSGISTDAPGSGSSGCSSITSSSVSNSSSGLTSVVSIAAPE